MIYETFEQFEAWKLAREIRIEISKLILICEKDNILNNQITRAARSVSANIAEGFGRYHYQEKIQYCRQARGSLFEVLDHLWVAKDEKYITDADFDKVRALILKENQLINSYISFLKNKKSGLINKPGS